MFVNQIFNMICIKFDPLYITSNELDLRYANYLEFLSRVRH